MVVFGKSGCIRAKVVVFKQNRFIRAKVIVFVIIGCNQAKWLYSGKVVVFGKVVLFGQK